MNAFRRIYDALRRWRLRQMQKAIEPILLARARESCLRHLGYVPPDLKIEFGTRIDSKVRAVSKDF